MLFSLISQLVVGFMSLYLWQVSETVKIQLPSEPIAIPTVGVKECDEFVKKYMSCMLSKVPASQRDVLTEAMRKTVESWKNLTTNEASKTGLAESCKAAMESVKSAMVSFGCEF